MYLEKHLYAQNTGGVTLKGIMERFETQECSVLYFWSFVFWKNYFPAVWSKDQNERKSAERLVPIVVL